MQFLDPALEVYCESNSGAEPPYLQDLAVETRQQVAMPQMLSGALQGRFLAWISRLVGPRTIVELGTYTGYSALCLAEGLVDGGMVHTIDIDPALGEMVRGHVSKAGMQDRIKLHHGPALDVLPLIPAPFDLVFIDADKENYPAYLEAVLPKVRSGGVIVADNVLWSGKVLAPPAGQDAETRALVEYARRVRSRPELEPVMIPLRDGLLVARKR